MTAALVQQQNLPAERSSSRARPQLRVLDQAAARQRRRRRGALALLFVVLLTGLFGVAFVHAQLVESQQDLDDMRTRIRELEAEKAQIERAVDEASSPAVVVERATELGMVRAEEPVYLAAVRGPGQAAGGTGGG